jgi:hypothetical protein
MNLMQFVPLHSCFIALERFLVSRFFYHINGKNVNELPSIVNKEQTILRLSLPQKLIENVVSTRSDCMLVTVTFAGLSI